MEEVVLFHQLQPQPHYPLVAKMLLDLFGQGELPDVRSIMLEPDYGFVGRVVYKNDAIRMLRGTDVGINTSAATQIMRDKTYTKYFLQMLGYCTPPGKLFWLPLEETNDNTLDEILEEINHYIYEVIRWPCFLKPNEGRQGKGVVKCFQQQDVAVALAARLRMDIQRVLVEQAITWPEYRVVVLEGEVVLCYRRHPLAVVGDGSSTLRELLHQKQEVSCQQGNKVFQYVMNADIACSLQRRSFHLETVLRAGEVCPLSDRANLSVGGEAEDCTGRLCPRWRDLCVKVTEQMGLHFCGIDLFCTDIECADAEYSILEINGSPGFYHYAAQGSEQYERVRSLYKRIFAYAPLSCR